MTAPPNAPVRVPVTLFYSYAHEDETLRNELQDHLMILERRGVIKSWHDRAIVAGHDWNQEIDEHLRGAELVLLLISKDFIASDYIMSAELSLAMERQRNREAVVVPIMLRQVDLQPEDEEDMPFVGLLKGQGLPRDLKPVTSWPNRDEAWTHVASGLRATVKEINARRPAAPPISRARGMAPSPPSPVAPAAAPVDPSLFAEVCSDYTKRVNNATIAKGGAPIDEHDAREQARRLIELPDAKRILWVDDHPANNEAEQAALARLQIETVAVRSTGEALQQLSEAKGDDAFDLVISDWSRDNEATLAGLRLLNSMREREFKQPLIFYHGTLGRVQRSAIAISAKAAGAFGEAVHPDQLMGLVLDALETAGVK